MKNFSKAIDATCMNCYISEVIRVETIKEAKEILEKNYGWTKSKIGWTCAECSTESFKE